MTLHVCGTVEEMAIDWERLRRRLGDKRRSAGYDEGTFADLIRVNKSTIYRIENVLDLPEHRPDLDTIEAWLHATDGSSLAELFREIQLQTDDKEPNNVARTDEVAGGPAHGGRSSDSPSRDSTHILRAMFLEVSAVFANAAAALNEADRSDSGLDADASRGGRRPTGTGE